jgi:hypothetical protein
MPQLSAEHGVSGHDNAHLLFRSSRDMKPDQATPQDATRLNNTLSPSTATESNDILFVPQVCLSPAIIGSNPHTSTNKTARSDFVGLMAVFILRVKHIQSITVEMTDK